MVMSEVMQMGCLFICLEVCLCFLLFFLFQQSMCKSTFFLTYVLYHANKESSVFNFAAPAITINPMLRAYCCFQYKHGHKSMAEYSRVTGSVL